MNRFASIRFDTRIVALLRDDLLPWQELNVTAFLMAGIATSEDGIIGEPYEDADGNSYQALLRQPVVVMTADLEKLRQVRAKAKQREFAEAIYTSDMFITNHDAANRAVVSAVAADELDLVGEAVRGARNPVDRIVKGAKLHE